MSETMVALIASANDLCSTTLGQLRKPWYDGSTMGSPLLTTKLYMPPSRPDLLPRPRLIRRLDEGLRLHRRLTLLSAPAGYGKTTLLADWVASAGQPVAWLSLDQEDNDPVRFWTYLIAALQQMEPDLGQGIPDALRAPRRPPTEALLTSLINQIAGLSRSLVLVLDDYHLIEATAIHAGMAFFLDHLPANAHLVLATRADPPLSLARLRGRGQLTELRQADLRFTLDEAAVFLDRVSGFNLSAEDMRALEQRTEGWITGLQLAALSLQGHDDAYDASAFVLAFSGSHRYVLDYLTEEVMRRQPEGIRAFLLRTSILERLSGPLCDTVLRVGDSKGKAGVDGSSIWPLPASLSHAFADSQSVLEYLEATNLFVVPLDDRRAWYRYHRLFGDLLRARLEELHPESVPGLHRRASTWYEREGLVDDAMKHALAANDSARAAAIVEDHGRTLLMRGELFTLLRWIESLAPEQIQASAAICVTHAWALLLTGRLGAVEPRLQRVEQLVPSDSPLLGDVAAVRAYATSQRGDIPRTIELAEQALRLLPSSKLGERAVVFFVLGGAHLVKGDVPAAADAFGRAAAVGQEGGNLHLTLPALNSLASLQVSQGNLRRAKATAQEAVELVAGPDGRPLPIAAGALTALADLAYEENRLDEALALANQSVKLARLWGNADTLGFSYLTLVHVFLALGRIAEARVVLEEAQGLSEEATLFPWFNHALRAAWARFWLRRGDLGAAVRSVEQMMLRTMEVLTAGENLTAARVYWASGRVDDALDVIHDVLEVAREQDLVTWLVRGLALRAAIDHAEDRQARALNTLAEALTLAEPERYVRSFVDPGPVMASLLERAVARGVAPGYVEDLLSIFDRGERDRAAPPAQPLVEPLSEREMEVLSLVAQGLSNREVGRQLHIAESTVKSHLNSVYGKLGVANRTQAGAKARELSLF